jgi:hypothetical protein
LVYRDGLLVEARVPGSGDLGTLRGRSMREFCYELTRTVVTERDGKRLGGVPSFGGSTATG